MAIEPHGANKNENNEMKMFTKGVMILFAYPRHINFS